MSKIPYTKDENGNYTWIATSCKLKDGLPGGYIDVKSTAIYPDVGENVIIDGVITTITSVDSSSKQHRTVRTKLSL